MEILVRQTAVVGDELIVPQIVRVVPVQQAVLGAFYSVDLPGIERTVGTEAFGVGSVGWVGCLGFVGPLLGFAEYKAFFKVGVLAFEEIVLVRNQTLQAIPEVGVGGDF